MVLYDNGNDWLCGARPDSCSLRGKLATTLFDFFLIPSLIAGQFARQDDVALSIAVAFDIERVIPELLVVGAERQVARPVQAISMNAFGLGAKQLPPRLAECLRHNMLDLRRLEISRFLVSACAFKCFEHLAGVTALVKGKCGESGLELMVVRPAPFQQVRFKRLQGFTFVLRESADEHLAVSPGALAANEAAKNETAKHLDRVSKLIVTQAARCTFLKQREQHGIGRRAFKHIEPGKSGGNRFVLIRRFAADDGIIPAGRYELGRQFLR